jgi:hypothetical protein
MMSGRERVPLRPLLLLQSDRTLASGCCFYQAFLQLSLGSFFLMYSSLAPTKPFKVSFDSILKLPLL